MAAWGDLGLAVGAEALTDGPFEPVQHFVYLAVGQILYKGPVEGAGARRDSQRAGGGKNC